MVTENEDWLEKHLLEAYLKAKDHNARWDASVSIVFGLVAGQRVRSNDDPAVRDKIGKIASTANADGCRDPYVRYLVLRYGLREPAGKEELKRALANGGLGRELSATADDLTRVAYPPDVVFEATSLAFSANWGKATDFELEQLREKALNSVLAILIDQTYPASRVQKDVATMLSLAGSGSGEYEVVWRRIEPILFKNWYKFPFPNLIKGEYHYNLGWRARGGGYSDSVTKEAWKTFHREEGVSEQCFRDAWKLDNTNPDTARWMIEVCVCQSHSRREMERWFSCAMAADPSYYPACLAKLRFLEPKWFGSSRDMIEFGHQCATNLSYKGRVPGLICDVYLTLSSYYEKREEQEQFLAQPLIWSDVSNAFSALAQREPTVT